MAHKKTQNRAIFTSKMTHNKISQPPSVFQSVIPANNDSVLRIDLFLSLFLLILTIALADCYFRLFSYAFFGTVQSGIACFLLGLSIVLVAFISLRKKISIYSPRFDFADLLFFVVFGFLFANKIVFPDWGSDTGTAEVFVQNFMFTDKLEDLKPYYLPLVSAWYGLSNRVFFYVRSLLGYRLTMFVNIFIIIITYYKLKELLIYFWQDSKPMQTLSRNSATISGICVSTLLVLFSDSITTGMIWQQKSDLFILPLFFECLRLAFCYKNLNRCQYIFASLLAGTSAAFKLTNIVFFIPLIVYVIFRDIRNKLIKPSDFLLSSVAFLLPILPFALYGVLFTGSPIFPFYNEIFKSPYFADLNFTVIERLGPRNIIEILFWPIIVTFNTTRFGEVFQLYNIPLSNGRMFIGYIVTLGSIILYKKTGLLKNRLPLIFCLLGGIVLWSAAATGYVRYAYTAELFCFLIVVILIFDLINLNKPILAGLNMSVLAISLVFSFFVTVKLSPDWQAGRPSIFTYGENFFRDEYFPNLSFLGRDRNITDDPELQQQFDNVRTWIYLHGIYTAHGIIANPHADFFWYDWTIYHQIGSGQIEDKTEFAKKYFENRDKSGLFSLIRADIPSIFDQYLEFGFVPINAYPVKLNTIDANRIFYFVEWQLDFE